MTILHHSSTRKFVGELIEAQGKKKKSEFEIVLISLF
uniref:Vesicle-associated protein 1-3-like n=1 Tax=Rhizophora mucronata TaxID=61149 RepID=A0A2P2K6H3_RHIMU